MLDTQETLARMQSNIEHYLGPLKAGLQDPRVVEVMLNPDGKIFHDVLGVGLVDTGITMDFSQARTLIGAVAIAVDRPLSDAHPFLECELPGDASRFTALLPPIVSGPTITLRKKAMNVFSIDDYVSAGIATAAQGQLLKDLVAAKKNVLIAGETGSGKSTLINALLAHVAQIEPLGRVILIEDVSELQCSAVNSVSLHTQPNIDIRTLVQRTMRLRPDRIFVGEVRGGEALDLLKAWGTGHPGGAATIHSDSPQGALIRLEQLIGEVSARVDPRVIVAAVGCVVSIQRDLAHPAGRCIKQIALVRGVENGVYQFESC